MGLIKRETRILDHSSLWCTLCPCTEDCVELGTHRGTISFRDTSHITKFLEIEFRDDSEVWGLGFRV